MKLNGIKKMQKNLSSMKNSGKLYTKALIKFLVKVEANSTKRTPIDIGFLRKHGKGHGKILHSSDKGAEGSIANTSSYAVFVHERTDIRHANGTEAKFLENALKEEAGNMGKDITMDLRGLMFKKDMA